MKGAQAELQPVFQHSLFQFVRSHGVQMQLRLRPLPAESADDGWQGRAR